MSLLYKFFEKVDSVKPAQSARAHCDVPCGIYDPYEMQVAAHSVIRMVQLIKEAKDDMHKKVRCTVVKEQSAERVKHEARIIMGDYIKKEHVDAHPELHEIINKIMKLGSKTRQEVSEDAAKELLAEVQKFAEIFWKTKGVATTRVKAPYPSGGDLVVPKQ